MIDEYIWVSRWEEFQTYQTKRGKPWSPPWIRLYPRLLDNDEFMGLTEPQRLLLVGLFMLFSNSRGTIAKDTRSLSRKLNQRVTKQMLQRLNDAGFIQFCSGTVLEQRRNMFWNGSALEVEVDVDVEQPTPLVVKETLYEERANGQVHEDDYELLPAFAYANEKDRLNDDDIPF